MNAVSVQFKFITVIWNKVFSLLRNLIKDYLIFYNFPNTHYFFKHFL